jgi:hypothetical protein
MDEAIRYYKDLQYDKVCQLMYSLHRNFEKSVPDSHNEILFYQKYSYRINEAFEYLKNFWNKKVPNPVNLGGVLGYSMNDLSTNVMAMHEVITIYDSLITEMRNEMDSMTTVVL